MLFNFIAEQLKRARYELIDRGSRYYGSIPGLRGVWATGKTLEECRERLLGVLEGWLVLRFKKTSRCHLHVKIPASAGMTRIWG